MTTASSLPDPVKLAMPVLAFVILVDVVVKALRGRRDYELYDSASSLVIGFGFVAIVGPLTKFAGHIAQWVYHFRLFSIGYQWWAFVLCFLADDLVYYWFHRLAHEHRWFWTTHVTHHDSQHMNLFTGPRIGWLLPIYPVWWVGWLPLYLLGIPPELALFQKGLSKIYQLLLHTESVGKLPRPIEWIFNTPWNHRVHHARHPYYLDRNYGGILIVWDRIFGTYVEENEAIPLRYGVVKNVGTLNPLRVVTYPLVDMLRDVARAKTWRERYMYLMGPPGWSPDGSRKTAREMRAEWDRAPLAARASPDPTPTQERGAA